jgi:hypothetical protein
VWRLFEKRQKEQAVNNLTDKKGGCMTVDKNPKNNRFEKELETAVNNLTDKRFEELAKTYNLRKI